MRVLSLFLLLVAVIFCHCSGVSADNFADDSIKGNDLRFKGNYLVELIRWYKLVSVHSVTRHTYCVANVARLTFTLYMYLFAKESSKIPRRRGSNSKIVIMSTNINNK